MTNDTMTNDSKQKPLSALVDKGFVFKTLRFRHGKVNGWSFINQMIDLVKTGLQLRVFLNNK